MLTTSRSGMTSWAWTYLVPTLLRPSDSPYEQLQVVVGGIDHGGTGKPLRGRVLLAYAAVEDHDVLVSADLASLAQFREGGEGSRGFGAHVAHPLAAREQLHVRDRPLVHRQGRAARFTERIEDQEVPHRGRHPDARRPGTGVFPGRGEALAAFECPDDGGAALRLHADHPRPFPAYQPERFQLPERLPHPDQARPPSRRVDDHVGKAPVPLLRQLQPHRLLALDAVRLLQRADVEGPGPLGEGRRDATAVAYQALHQHQATARGQHLVLAGGRRVRRPEHPGLPP